ncbi:MAG: tRNA (adenosine(37)-N6)-dimethylallyltransferase MiaA [Bacteroidota bacterium]
MKKPPFLIVVCGPTASGKTRLAVDLAFHFKTEVISADSRQFYRELYIGTAKPGKKEQRGVFHHFIDSLSIEDNYSAGDFERDALDILNTLFKDHNVVILAGGSGLFIDAVCKGFDSFPEIPEAIRQSVRTLYEAQGIEGLTKALKKEDPEYLLTVDQNNPQRMTRALEVSLTAGQPYSAFRKKKKNKRPFETIKIAYTWDRETLYQRINDRVDVMLEQGLEAEVKALDPFRQLNALQTVGYQEWFPYFDGGYSKAEAIRLIKRNTRRYAKRQLTWFRRDETIQYFLPDTPLKKVIHYLEEKIND